MKKIILLITASLIINFLNAQDCNSAREKININFIKLNYNNLKYGIAQLGLPNLDEETGAIIDDGDIKTLYFANGLWLGGVTESGEVRTAGSTYVSLTNNFDFYPGPLNNDGTTYPNQCQFWDRTFVITKVDVKIAINLLFNSDGSINSNVCDQLPAAVLNWPGKGNENLQPFMPTSEMAEFYDHNQDGIYNPCEGDLPSLVAENCSVKVGDILASFPKVLTFSVRNDAGGPHLLTAGNPLGVEIHDYYFAFEGTEALETALFSRHKVINKSPENYDNFYIGTWLDPDVGCAYDDLSGCISERNMTFSYNEDAEDGDNGINCSGGSPTFEHPPMVGTCYLKGLLNEENEDTGLTSAFNTFNCSSNPPSNTLCDPENEDGQFYNVFLGLNIFGEPIIINGDTTTHMFDGNPADPLANTMCKVGLSNVDTRTIMSTGGVKLPSGGSHDVILAYYTTFKATLPCPDVNILLEVQDEMEALYNNCWKSTSAPDAPELVYKRQTNDIEVTLTNAATSNNINDSYEALILGAPNQSDSYKYKFEGYKVYQVMARNTAISALEDPNFSWLVYQTDVDNAIEDISNWKTSYDANNTKSWVQEQQVNGSNQGVEHTFTLDYDYLNNKPIERNQEYYLIAVAYGYNEYEVFNPITELGQKSPYIQSNNLKVITIGKALDNEKLAAQITRLSGQGNMNDLEITEQSYADIINQSNDGRITYKINKGPFDITVIDESLLPSVNKFELKVTGPWDNSSSTCAYDPDETFIQITDLISGNIYLSDQPISLSKDHTFNELGLIVSVHDIDIPGDHLEAANGGINQRIKYLDENGPVWLGSIHDGRALPGDINLLPQQTSPKYDRANRYSQFGANLLFPMGTSGCVGEDLCISTTSSNLFRLAQISRAFDLDNIDIVLTPDKSKWSRCIVVETASQSYDDVLPEIHAYDFVQVKKNHVSVDQNGQPDGTGEGMGWFPGYAINVETGQRLNIFFGENSNLSDPSVPMADASIVDDMIWNPSDEFYDNSDPSKNPLVKAICGGQHFIYVTEQTYDECSELYDSFSKSVVPFRDLSTIIWTMAPIINADFELLPIEEGLIPNEARISLRVNNKFAKTDKNENLEDIRKCIVFDDAPVYEFEIVDNPGFNGTINPNLMNVPWAFALNINMFRLFNVEEDLVVSLMDLSSNLVDQWAVSANSELNLNENELPTAAGIYLINVRSSESGVIRSYKVVVM